MISVLDVALDTVVDDTVLDVLDVEVVIADDVVAFAFCPSLQLSDLSFFSRFSDFSTFSGFSVFSSFSCFSSFSVFSGFSGFSGDSCRLSARSLSDIRDEPDSDELLFVDDDRSFLGAANFSFLAGGGAGGGVNC